MIRDTEYMSIVSEVYDLSDYKTKKAVLFCNEAQKNANIEHIVGKLYNHIKNGTDNIDFGSIPKSKGIVTNIDNYQQIVDCINTIKDLLVEYNEKTDLIDQLNDAFANIQARERLFSKAFALNIEFPMMIYNTTVLSVVAGLSVMISSSIEYIKNGHDSYEASFNKTRYAKSKDHVLYQYVRDFNNICRTGKLDKLMQDSIQKNIVKESFYYNSSYQNINIINEDSGIAGIVALIIGIGASVYAFLKLVNYVIYYFMFARMSLSEWFAVQARFLEINAENLKHRDDPKGEDHKKKSYQNQLKLVQIFNKVSNALALKDSKAKQDANEQKKQEERRKHEEDDRRDNDSSDDDGSLF